MYTFRLFSSLLIHIDNVRVVSTGITTVNVIHDSQIASHVTQGVTIELLPRHTNIIAHIMFLIMQRRVISDGFGGTIWKIYLLFSLLKLFLAGLLG